MHYRLLLRIILFNHRHGIIKDLDPRLRGGDRAGQTFTCQSGVMETVRVLGGPVLPENMRFLMFLAGLCSVRVVAVNAADRVFGILSMVLLDSSTFQGFQSLLQCLFLLPSGCNVPDYSTGA
jgi:hypothetical protein